MARVKTFADTSSVSLAYGITDAADANTVSLSTLKYIPFTEEGFSVSKEAAESAAIRPNRRSKGRKNTRGSAAGSAGLEFGFTSFIHDMLALAAMNEWVDIGEDGEQLLTDGDTTRFFLVEKRIKAVRDSAKHNDFRRFYGNLVNEATIEVGDDLIGFTVNTMAAAADVHTAAAGSNDNAGGLASTYEIPDDYEVADSSNNIKSTVVRDSNGDPLEITFADFSVSISNNVREQRGVGNQFSAGMGMGKVAVQVTGTAYYFDNTVLDAHLDNHLLSFETEITTAEGTYLIQLPRVKAGSPEDSAGGENQDYQNTIELTAEEGEVTVGGTTYPCVIAITKLAS